MIIYGIDPSTKTGIAIYREDWKDIKLAAFEIELNQNSELNRFLEVEKKIADLVQSHGEKYGKKYAYIEGYSFGSFGASKGRYTSLLVGIGTMIRVTLYKNNCSVIEVSPSFLKKFTTGRGTANKTDMAISVYKRWGFESKSTNEIDAYALMKLGMYHQGVCSPTEAQSRLLVQLEGGI